MLYNSFDFLFKFLPACLLVYFAAAKVSRRLANILLCLGSFYFYAWKGSWLSLDYHRLAIVAVSIVVNYAFGLLLRQGVVTGKHAFALLTIGVTGNLAALAYFKYANFALWNWSYFTGHPFSRMDIALPLGISFFTFTQIAFLVDAYRQKARELGFARYCLFVAFFPHLIAGPIVHHAELMPQFSARGAKRWIPENVSLGIGFLTLGLFKKVIIADSIAPWANQVFDTAAHVGCLDAWRGALAYTLQLYFDFSGYCDMAIGLAWMFNIRLPDNFDGPYKSTSIIDFWRRWHMTLSRFLRDYLYIPLGGNRLGENRRKLNLMLTMLLGGVWHGAGWTYVVWGTYHGILLTINHAWDRRQSPLPKWLARAVTFLVVIIGWVVFRAKSMHIAGDRLRSMIGFGGTAKALIVMPQAIIQFSVITALILLANLAPTTKDWLEQRPLGVRRAILLGILFFICVIWMRDAALTGKPREFIYFQF